MLCRICGTPIKAGEKFCSLCGTKAEVTEESYGNQAQQDGRQPDNQQPYRQQSGRYFDQPYGQQQRSNMYYSEQTESKKGLWITLSLVAVLAIAAILVFTVFGDKLAAPPQSTPQQQVTLPFKGDTPQTNFTNDTAKVMCNTFEIFENVGIDLNELADQPFDIKLDMNAKSMGDKASIKADMAYDNETFGMNMNAEGTSVKALFIDDVMYMDFLGNVYGIDFNSKEDLSQPMTLIDRATALGLYVQQNTGEKGYTPLAGLLIQSTLSGGKYIPLAELLINSIDKSCFENSGSVTTLTLDAGDIVDTLRTFAGKLEADEGLKEMYKDFVKENSGTAADAIKQINDAADTLEGQKETSELEIVWSVSYKDEKPVSFEISANDGDQKYVYSFGYDQNEDGTKITFELTSGNTSDSISGTCAFKKAGSGTEFTGSIIVQGQVLVIYGNIAFSGNNTHGTITMNAPDTGEATIDFNLTVNRGMPDIRVKDDGRFHIDTSNANMIDRSSMSETYGLPGLY